MRSSTVLLIAFVVAFVAIAQAIITEDGIAIRNEKLKELIAAREEYLEKIGTEIICDGELCRLQCVFDGNHSGYCPQDSTCICV